MAINNKRSLKEKIKNDARLDYSSRMRKLIPQHGFESITTFSIACNDGIRNTRTSTHLTGGVNIYLESLVNECSTLKIPLFYYLDLKEDLVLEKINGYLRFKDKGGSVIVNDYLFNESASSREHYINCREVIADNLLLLRKLKNKSQLKSEQDLGIFDSNLSSYERSKRIPTLTQLAIIAHGYKVKIYQLLLPISTEHRKLIGREEGWLQRRIEAEQAEQDNLAGEIPKEVQRLLLALGSDGITLPDLMATLKLKDARRFTEKYIKPALEQKLIRIIKSKQDANSQDYYKLTGKGRSVREGIEER